MSEPDVTVSDWAPHLRKCRFVTVKLSAQSAADLCAAMNQAWMGHCDADLNLSAYNEFVRKLSCLTGLPEPSRVR